MRIDFKKITNYVFFVIVFAAFSMMYFIWQPYDKCLLQPAIIISKEVIFDLLTRIIYYLLYFTAIRLILKAAFVANYKNELPQRKDITKYYLSLFGVRILFDVLIYVLNLISVESEITVFAVYVILETIFNASVILLAAFLYGKRAEIKESKKRKLFACAVAILFAAVVVLLAVLNVYNNRNYGDDSQVLKIKLFTCNMLRDMLTSSLALAMAYVLFKNKESESNTYTPALKTIAVLCLRVGLVALVFVAVNFIKMIVLPHSMLIGTESLNGVTYCLERASNYADAFNFIR